MKTLEALQILEQALNSANLKGVYSLKDASLIIQALTVVSEQLNTNKIPSIEEL